LSVYIVFFLVYLYQTSRNIFLKLSKRKLLF